MPYRNRTGYRPPRRTIASVNRMVARLAVPGLTPRNTVALEVPGRQSGKMRRTSLVVAEHGSSRYLVSLAGESEWVQNVRANNFRASLRRLRSRQVRLVELPAEQRPPVLRAYLSKRAYSKSPQFEAREFFGVSPNASLEDLAEIAGRYRLPYVRGHEKVPTGGQVWVPISGQLEVPRSSRVSCPG
jgi:F420H(2)-dependent quinone reductase